MRTTNNARSNGNWQGMNWIRQEKRLAIYLRDGCACAWCGATLEGGAKLTLDHLTPHSKGGSNNERNLVTCCKACNDSRGARSVRKFAIAVATYINHGVTADDITAHVRACSRRALKPFIAEAKALIALRGSAFAVLNQKGN
jgi:hypothetical protein